eukprot:PhF_6_TR39471/c0_g1_i1/m.58625
MRRSALLWLTSTPPVLLRFAFDAHTSCPHVKLSYDNTDVFHITFPVQPSPTRRRISMPLPQAMSIFVEILQGTSNMPVSTAVLEPATKEQRIHAMDFTFPTTVYFKPHSAQSTYILTIETHTEAEPKYHLIFGPTESMVLDALLTEAMKRSCGFDNYIK